MSKCKRPYTFNDWMMEEAGGSIKHIDPSELETNGYQSDYVYKYNILREAGWVREKGMWIHPYQEARFSKIDDAYSSQKLWELRYESKED